MEAEARLRAERDAESEAEEKAKAYDEAIARAKEKLAAEVADREKSKTESRIEIREVPAKTGACECCGKKDVPKDNLSIIDSGQMCCPDCLIALRG